jgi:hypothetical protein
MYDPDCDIGGRNDSFYVVGSDGNGEYLQDDFGAGAHGYLHGVILTSGPPECSHSGPSLTDLGRIILAILIVSSAAFIILKRGVPSAT